MAKKIKLNKPVVYVRGLFHSRIVLSELLNSPTLAIVAIAKAMALSDVDGWINMRIEALETSDGSAIEFYGDRPETPQERKSRKHWEKKQKRK
jgi:hypothetical protein